VCRDVDLALRDDPAVLERESTVVRQALAGVARARGRGGTQAVAEMLRGQTSDRVRRFGFDGLSTFGLLADRNQDDVMRLLRALLAAGWIDLTSSEFPTPVLTAAGAQVMRAEAPMRIRLPRPIHRPREAHRPRSGAKKAKTAVVHASLPDGALFEALRVHRATIASEAGVAPFIVAHDRTLAEMAARRPLTKQALEDVPGMGPAKIARYGEGFLAVVRRATTS